MHILITGAAGMLGTRLAEALVRDGRLGTRAITALTLADAVRPGAVPGYPAQRLALDLGDPATAPLLVAGRPDVIVHLAAIVSGEAEADFDKGYRVNLDGTRALFEAIRAEGLRAPWCPRVVFASSLAVFGAPFPARIDDSFFLTPQTSYGTQKAIGELLLDDYSRRGILDGVGLRLPTICIRPGAPNRAASGFFSGILREPLAGKPAILPVSRDVRHWFASPRAAIGFLLQACAMDSAALGHRRNLTMPGVSATVGDQIEALRRVAGDRAVALIEERHDPAIAAIVAGWPQAFDAVRAASLGFVAEITFDAIIRAHVEDELGGRILT